MKNVQKTINKISTGDRRHSQKTYVYRYSEKISAFVHTGHDKLSFDNLIVLIPGTFSQTRSSFKSLVMDGTMDKLSKKYAIIGVDHDTVNRSIKESTEDVMAAISYYVSDIRGEVVLVGSSRGGLVAKMLASKGFFEIRSKCTVMTVASPLNGSPWAELPYLVEGWSRKKNVKGALKALIRNCHGSWYVKGLLRILLATNTKKILKLLQLPGISDQMQANTLDVYNSVDSIDYHGVHSPGAEAIHDQAEQAAEGAESMFRDIKIDILWMTLIPAKFLLKSSSVYKLVYSFLTEENPAIADYIFKDTVHDMVVRSEGGPEAIHGNLHRYISNELVEQLL